MPPQQPERLLDVFDEILRFRAHSRPIKIDYWPQGGISIPIMKGM
jgi:hypothetical protein